MKDHFEGHCYRDKRKQITSYHADPNYLRMQSEQRKEWKRNRGVSTLGRKIRESQITRRRTHYLQLIDPSVTPRAIRGRKEGRKEGRFSLFLLIL